MTHRHVFRFLLLLLLTLSHLVWGDTLVGKCVWVTDGDTATVQTESGEKYTVRFQGIDAPESAQSYGKEAKEALMGLILNKKVRVKVQGTDHYKRTLGQVYQGKKRINREMVALGYAWHSDYYAPNDKALAAAQRKARGARLGLWQEHAPTPPWEWRKANKKSKKKNSKRSFFWLF